MFTDWVGRLDADASIALLCWSELSLAYEHGGNDTMAHIDPVSIQTTQPAAAQVHVQVLPATAKEYWWTAAWVILFLFGVYFLINGGQTFISDGELMLQTAARIADYHTLTLTESAADFPQTVRGQGGFLFSRYGVGQPMAAAVLYLFGTHIVGSWLIPGSAAYNVGRFFALLLPAIATAVTGGVLYAWSAQLYRSVRIGVALALLYGLGTLALPYSRFFFSEPLYTCCLALAAYALYQGYHSFGGFTVGYAIATRIGGVFLLPAFLAYSWLLRRRWQDLLWFGIGLIPGGLLVLLNNWVRFRALTEQGYGEEGFTGNLFVGLAGLLFSPGKSLFLYVPLLLALPFAIMPFARRFRNEAVLVGLLTLITLLQSALWWTWWGGWGWGPRFLVPLLPFLVLPLGVLLARQVWRRIIFFGLFPLSVAINLLGVLVDFNDYLSEITRGSFAREQIYLWQPAYSPILAHIRRLDPDTIPIVSFQLSRPDIGFAEPGATLISLSIALLLLISLAALWRSVRRSPWLVEGWS
jgi:hypothetical protein